MKKILIIDPFVKINLKYDQDKVIDKKLSKILMQTRNPYFNQTFEFDLSKYLNDDNFSLNKFSLNFIIYDWNPVEKCEILGEVAIKENDMINIFNNENKVFISTIKLSNNY
jgi:hypothetical protein